MLRRLSRPDRWRVAHRPLCRHRSGNLNQTRTEALERAEFCADINELQRMLDDLLRRAREVD